MTGSPGQSMAAEGEAMLTAAGSGDQLAFTQLTEPHRRAIEVHCYRMTGSFTEAEDLAQETMLRAWRRIDTVTSAGTLRAWLYRIATNVTLDWLRGRPRRFLPFDVVGAIDVVGPPAGAVDYLAVEPFPDGRLPDAVGPDDSAVTRETLEIAFLAAIQHLPASQRAVLLLRDVEGWPARDVAQALGTTTTAVKSTLQRARATLKRRLPDRREEWASRTDVSDEERAVLQRYIAAHDSGDSAALAAVLVEDVRVAYAPHPLWASTRESFIVGSAEHALPGEYRFVALSVNLQPAVAIYNRPPEGERFSPIAVELLRIGDDRIVEIVDFSDPAVLARMGLPDVS